METRNVMHRKLGIFVMCVGAIQLALYSSVALGPKSWEPLFYFDPRIGWMFVESIFRNPYASPIGDLSWITAAVTLTVGIALFRSSIGIKTYLVTEAILALPTLAFIIIVAAANLSPAHGFSIGELFVPGIMFFLCSVLPFGMALFSGANRIVGA